ncbi:MAG: hypothetical protein [Circular genetic element sp.]|nr:MAG: hypothetical protein [Circular genetic element sp.]
MARRTSNKIEPAVQTMVFTLPVPSGQRTKFIDLSQCASLLNRRFYRQGLNWAVAGFKFISSPQGPTSTASIQVNKLWNSWTMSNSWEKSMRAWLRMNREAMLENESVRPRFLDYKIFMNKDHHDLGFEGNLLPLGAAPFGGASSFAKRGEWEASKVVIPSQTTNVVQSFELVAVGPNSPGVSPVTGLNALSLVEGYASSRSLPAVLDPNVPDDAADPAQNWITSIFSDGTQQDDEVIDDMISENNVAPYPFENGPDVDLPGTFLGDTQYVGGANNMPDLQFHDIANVSQTTVGGTTRMKGGNFPCGLISIQTNGFDDLSTMLVQIDLVPGSHRGYLCEPMTEM